MPSPQLRRALSSARFVASEGRDTFEIRALSLDDVEAGAAGTVLGTAKAKAEAMKRLKSGELAKLSITATTFIQRDTPNRNFVRFKPGMMPTFGKSFAGQPFLKDHSSRSLDARGGTIVGSKLVHNDDGSKHIEMELEIVKAWAMEGVLDGTIDRFSIGWSRTGVVECSIHEAAISKCDCWPGDKMADGRVCEFVFTAAEGTEVSAVNVPAVVGTGIGAISQLGAVDRADLLCMLMDTDTPGETDMKLILAALALAATATEQEAVAAIEARDDELTVAKEQLTAAKAELVTLHTERATETAAETKKKTDATIAKLVASGKLKPGSKTEDALRRTAKRDHATFEAQTADMLENGARVTPIGAAPIVKLENDPDPTPNDPAEAELAENPHLAASLRKAGITLEQYKKHSAGALKNIADKRAAGY